MIASDAADPMTETVASAVARFIRDQGVERVYSLVGSHMKPIWSHLDRLGVRVVTARHEVAAIHMAQAEADLEHRLAVAIVTTGPGFTNALTGIACAYLAESPVLVITTRPPTQQTGMGALEEVDQPAMARAVCRAVEVVRTSRGVLDRMDRAVTAALGEDGPSGPVLVEFPTEVLRQPAERAYTTYPRRNRTGRIPEESAVQAARESIAGSARPLVISGRDALMAPEELRAFVDSIGAAYLDTRASKGSLSSTIPTHVPAMRAKAMESADLVITVSCRLDFEVAYGSPAVFESAQRFLRLGRNAEEVQHNRRGDVELRADPASGLAALLSCGAAPREPDKEWLAGLVSENQRKVEKRAVSLRSTPDGRAGSQDGLMHPYQLIGALNEYIDEDTIVVVDGGDILSWSRSALRAPTYLDLGSFGCLGVGVPFANAASLVHPGRRVVALVGDGALGFNVMELETAVREGTEIVVVVANNNAWNIERNDQVLNYDRVFGTELGACAFDAVAEGLGVRGYRVDAHDQLDAALSSAFASAPALVNVRVSGEPLSPDTKSGLALVPEYQALEAWDEAERAWLGDDRDR